MACPSPSASQSAQKRFTHTYIHTHNTQTHTRRGVNKWRDRELPVQILEEWCKVMDVNPPEWSHDKTKVIVDHTEYTLDHFGGFSVCVCVCVCVCVRACVVCE